ncbi:hypothetical protein V8E54_012352 [Elaphomyces granulatus]
MDDTSNFSRIVHDSFHDFVSGGPDKLVELLEDFFRQRAPRTLLSAYESVFQVLLEILWFRMEQTHFSIVPELHLTSKHINSFADIFIRGDDEKVVVIELKGITLEQLWDGDSSNAGKKAESIYCYSRLLRKLSTASENDLLGLEYAYKDSLNEKRKVRNMLESAITQVTGYMDLISCGNYSLMSKWQGINDRRVGCQSGGRDELLGYVLICIGGRRVVYRKLDKIRTRYRYVRGVN